MRIHLRTLIVRLSFAVAAFGFAALAQAQAKPPATVVLKGSPLGAVKFDHALHTRDGVKCDACHHASRPEKPMTAAQQKCTDCHTKAAAAPMKTKLQAAFHDPMAKKGTCVDCHQTTAKGMAKGPVPSKCADCHKKENG